MVMDFWEAQRHARKQTAVYLAFFVFLTLAAAFFLELGMRYFAQDQYNPSWPALGLLFLGLTFIAAFFQYCCFMSLGGKYVAESMGARLADASQEIHEAQLLNIVKECAIASSLPIPKAYVIDAEQINAFAAGLSSENAVIAVTSGALKHLSREELQGVIAHEFGHISNGDMKIGLRLAAMLMGFYFILYIALRILQFSGRGRDGTRRSSESGKNPVLLAALILLVAGAITWFLGSLLKAAVSRQREYLADASSVQFTRNPEGISNALRKIEQETHKDMPTTGMAYSHLYLDDHNSLSSIFATHPPLKKRIEAIEGSFHRA
jgi:heat shock protein HtpX